MQESIAQFPSNCQECYASIKAGDPICRSGGSWIHKTCMERSIEQVRIVTMAQDAHRGSLDVGEMQYSVSYSRGSAMNWALKEGVVSQEEYDLVRKSRAYKLLWDYVGD